jgi:hypothetical protein
MKYAVGMGSVATIDIPSFIKIASGIQKLTGGGGHRHNGRMETTQTYFRKVKEKLLKYKLLALYVTLLG